MAVEKKLSKSIRKFIRREKSRIRREVLDSKGQEKLINELYQRFLRDNTKDKEKVNQKTG
jgi:hypothetical protein